MTVIFYSSTSGAYNAADFDLQTLPRRADVWAALAARYPQHRFVIATQPPGMFLLDGEAPADMPDSVQVRLLHGNTAGELAAELLELGPELAIAASFWQAPYDWLGVQDALIAETLAAHGIRTLCHPAQTALDCFDKTRTHTLLQRLGCAVPRTVYVHQQLYWCERGHRGSIRHNVYKEYVLRQIAQLRYPVVIKDTTGVSSYGTEVAVSYKQAVHYLNSGRTQSDRLVQEYIAGEQFGAEIYGSAGRYAVMPPLALSLNRYGITSPKLGEKHGPVTDSAHGIDSLRALLERLAQELHFSGVAQADVILHEGTWYVIELNPRLSGMTETYAAALGISVPQLLLDIALGTPPDAARLQPVRNQKLPLATEAQLHELYRQPGVRYVHQVHNKAARQEREKGYCEVVSVLP